jgi:hypothetical protein
VPHFSLFLGEVGISNLSSRPKRAKASAVEGPCGSPSSRAPLTACRVHIRLRARLMHQTFLYTQNYPIKKIYPAFFRVFVPMRNSFRTVPVGSRFI